MSERLRVGVVGAGPTGRGIAAAFARAGATVAVFDPEPDRLSVVPYQVALELDAVGADPAAADAVVPVGTVAAAASADLVFECAPEELALKRRLCAELSLLAAPEAIVATVSTTLTVAELAAAAPRPGRVLGGHWWEPVAAQGLVEVVLGEDTEGAVADRFTELLEAAGKSTVRVEHDLPGAVGDRLLHAMWREALGLLDAGVCDPETIDAVVRSGFGARLGAIGPIENADLVGLDLTAAIHSYLLPHLSDSTDPAAGLRARVEAGDLGVVTGRGYLEWNEHTSAEARARLAAALRGR